jgi:hypothetical protein
MNILAPKIGTLQVSPRKPNGDFLKNGSNNFIKIYLFMETIAINNCICSFFRKLMVCTLGTQMIMQCFLACIILGQECSTEKKYYFQGDIFKATHE